LLHRVHTVFFEVAILLTAALYTLPSTYLLINRRWVAGITSRNLRGACLAVFHFCR